MPARSFAIFCLAVAFTFAAIGVVNDLFDLEHSNTATLVGKIVSASSFAVVCVLLVYRQTLRPIILVAVLQLTWFMLAPHFSPPQNNVFTFSEWRAHVAVHAGLIIVFVLFSYGWFGTFFRMEGRRYYAAHTEIELASRIQQDLAPPIAIDEKEIEVFGISVPSGSVGGDLIDATAVNGYLLAYAADVAGHGVGAGVLMSMVKAAVHMHLTTSCPPGEGLLEAVNRVLAPLTGPASYATFAYILINEDKQVTYSAAGHPPIFHLHRNTVARHSVENLPVAMFPGTSYETAAIDFEPGDMLAIVTDGLTEVFDSKNRELGDSYISTILMRLSSRPLREISDEIFKTARNFGKITDDQSLLIARRQRKPHQGTLEWLAEVPGSESAQFAYGERYERLVKIHCSV
jgi:hypothetical protein